MKKLLIKIISVFLWAWFLISSVLLTPVMLIIWATTVLFDKRLRLLHLFSCFWGAQYIWLSPLWKLRVEGRNKIDNNKASIIICNHQSLVDIIVIYSLFRHFRWTSKAENFRIPFVGWVLFFNQSLKIYRYTPEAYENFRLQALKAVDNRNSLLIFPEGTRSRDTRLSRFKEGAFRIAHEKQLDIIPLVLSGTSAAIPKKGWSLTGSQKMFLKVLDPVPYEAYKTMSYGETAEMFRQMINKELNSRPSFAKATEGKT